MKTLCFIWGTFSPANNYRTAERALPRVVSLATLPRNQNRTPFVQPVVTQYTDWAIPFPSLLNEIQFTDSYPTRGEGRWRVHTRLWRGLSVTLSIKRKDFLEKACMFRCYRAGQAKKRHSGRHWRKSLQQDTGEKCGYSRFLYSSQNITIVTKLRTIRREVHVTGIGDIKIHTNCHCKP